MIHLIYISSATREMGEADLISLLEECRDRNERQNVTGMLLYKDGAFLQILEGEAQNVDEIYQSICIDERNAGNYLIERKEIEERNFPQWSMGFENLNNYQADDLKAYSVFFKKGVVPEEIAKHKDLAVTLLLNF